jgi:hypothetical protein
MSGLLLVLLLLLPKSGMACNKTMQVGPSPL